MKFRHSGTKFEPGKSFILIAGVAMMLLISYYGWWTEVDAEGNVIRKIIAWPWQTPIGSLVAFIWGYLLARRKEDAPEMPSPAIAPQTT